MTSDNPIEVRTEPGDGVPAKGAGLPFMESRSIAIASPGCCRSVETEKNVFQLCDRPPIWAGEVTNTVARRQHTDTIFVCTGHRVTLELENPRLIASDEDLALLLSRRVSAGRWIYPPWPGFEP